MSEPIPFQANSNIPKSKQGTSNATPPPFPAGSVVWLRSGSPAMTVSDLTNKPGIVTVDWFDADHCCHRNDFHFSQLTDSPVAWPSSVVLPNLMAGDLRNAPDVTERDMGHSDRLIE